MDSTNIKNEENILDEEELNFKEINYSLIIKDLYKSYGKKDVLKGLNLEVKKGEVFGFIGKNGIGKSTTIDCVVGLKDYDSGEILIMGVDNKLDPLKAKSLIGYVPSEPVTYEMMTGNEYLQFIGSSYGMIQNSFNKNYNFLIKKFTMTPQDMNRKIREYSHGMQQKVCLIAAMVANPPILVLDEPTVGLDAFTTEQLVSLVREHKEKGNTVVLASHNIELVSRIVDRVAIIHEGNLLRIFDFDKEENARKELPSYFLEHCKEKE